MGNDIRLIVVDLDGTTVGATNQISPAVSQALQAAQAKGVQVAIATGRMYRSALRFHKQIGSTLPLMSYQGAFIKDPLTEKVHQNLTVNRTRAELLLDYFEHPDLRHVISIHFYINDQLYVREMSEGTKEYISRSIAEPIVVGDLRNTLATEPTKVLALCDDPALIDKLLLGLQTRFTREEFYFTKSVATFLEATHPEVNKGAAVQYIAGMLGLESAQVMTLGDNFNDLEMLQYAGIGVAMGDAPDGVKAIADWVAPSVEADGVVAAIEKFVL
jgi:Cof subfamily protein (haloacid dehalogenase superfamily)